MRGGARLVLAADHLQHLAALGAVAVVALLDLGEDQVAVAQVAAPGSGSSRVSLERRSTGSTRISRRALRITPRMRWALWPSRLISRASISPPSSARRSGPAAGRPGRARAPSPRRVRAPAGPAARPRRPWSAAPSSSPSASRSTTSATPTGGQGAGLGEALAAALAQGAFGLQRLAAFRAARGGRRPSGRRRGRCRPCRPRRLRAGRRSGCLCRADPRRGVSGVLVIASYVMRFGANG